MSATDVDPRDRLEHRLVRVAWICALGAALISSVVLTGWMIGESILQAFLPRATTMKANLALGVLTASCTTVAIALGRRGPAVSLAAAFVFALGAATLAEDIFGLHLGIDELLVHDPMTVGTTGAPGRMAPNAALSLVLSGAGAWLLGRDNRSARIGQACAALVAVIGLLAIFGYAYGAERLYNLRPSVTALAFPASMSLFLLGTAMILAGRGGVTTVLASPDAGGVLLRRLIPVALCAPLGVDLIVRRVFTESLHSPLHAEALSITITTLGMVALLFAVASPLDRQASASRRASEKLAQQEQLYRELFTNMDAAFAYHTVIFEDDEPVDYVFEEINDAFVEQTGLAREEVVGKRVTEVLPGIEDDPADWIGRLGRVAQTGEPERFEQRSENLDRWYSVLAYQPRPGSFASVFSDVTERREAQMRIERLNRRLARRTAELAEANDRLESFNYSVSHDLRAPLRAIDGFSEAVLEDYGEMLPEEGHKYLARVRAAAQRMGRLIDDLLQLSRLGRAEMKVQPVDLTAIARDVVSELRDGDPARQVDVEVAEGLHAQADRRMTRMLLANLIGNAWKFTSKQQSAHIEVGELDEEGERRFYVRDDGAGFDPTYTDKLFGAFQRLHTDAEFLGTGIGLATVQRIVDRHGGRVWGEGQLDEGATFWFTLPPAEDAEEADPPR